MASPADVDPVMAHGHDSTLKLPLRIAPAEEPAAYAQGDPRTERLDGFLRAQRQDLLNFLRRRTPTEEDAQDAAQESMTRLLRYSASEPPVVWKSLLYRIATNVALDQNRRAQRHHAAQHVPLEDAELPSPAPSQEEAAVRQEMLARARAAIIALPPKCRQVYLLSLEGWRHKQIAAHCGISVKMVEKHIARALAQVRREAGFSASGAFR